MADLVSIQNTFGAGRDFQQRQEFNSLRASGERQRQDIQQKSFAADQQQANSEKLLAGFAIMRENPNITPRVLDELGRSGIIDQNVIPQMLAEAQTSPQTFQQKMQDAESQIKLSLGQGPVQPKFGRAQAATRDGENVLIQTSPSGVTQEVEGFGPPTGGGLFGSGPSTETRTFQDLIDRLQDPNVSEDEKNAVRVELGLDPRAGTTSGLERRSTDEDLGGAVIEQLAAEAESTEFAKKTGVSRARTIDEGVASIQKIDINNRNLGKAIAAIDEGAQTGAIVSRFTPTVRAATVKLEQVQKLLGLDVIGAVTFGALSKGELDLALETALPTNLDPPELKQWLLDKQAANAKLRDYFSSQIEFVDTGGTLAGFLRQQERGAQTGGAAPDGTVITNAQGQSFIKQNGQWVPNG